MNEKKNVLIDLDSLLDVKLAIFESLVPNQMEEITKKYVDRKSDLFCNIPYNLFKCIYDKRSKAILNYAIPTNIIGILQSVVVTDREHITRTLEDNYIYVNSYPYMLTEKECKEFEKRLLFMIPTAKIKFVCLDYEKLSCEFLVNNNIETVIMYDGLDWLEKQVALNNIVGNPLVGRTLILPAIINTPDVKIKKEMFTKTAKAYGVIMELLFIDARYFSPQNKKK